MDLCMIRLISPHVVFISERTTTMSNISKEYLFLFNAITDMEESLALLRRELIAVQQRAEELFLEEPGPDDAQYPA